MELSEAALGRQVYLKSGSPALTIAKIYDNEETVDVRWYCKDKEKFEFAVFPIVCLTDKKPSVR